MAEERQVLVLQNADAEIPREFLQNALLVPRMGFLFAEINEDTLAEIFREVAIFDVSGDVLELFSGKK